MGSEKIGLICKIQKIGSKFFLSWEFDCLNLLLQAMVELEFGRTFAVLEDLAASQDEIVLDANGRDSARCKRVRLVAWAQTTEDFLLDLQAKGVPKWWNFLIASLSYKRSQYLV